MLQLHHRRLFDFDFIDKIVLEIVPRYKTSGLSGDEWRTGVVAKLIFKNHQVHELFYHDIETALAGLPWEKRILCEKSEPDVAGAVCKIEKGLCDQPSCSNPATNFFKLKRLTSARGELIDPADETMAYYRRFCERHSTRGDSSREDCDDNYEKINPADPNIKLYS